MQVYFQPAGLEQQEGHGCAFPPEADLLPNGSPRLGPCRGSFHHSAPDWATPARQGAWSFSIPVSTPAIRRSCHPGLPGTLMRNKQDNLEQDLCNAQSLFLDPQSVPLIQNLPPSATPMPLHTPSHTTNFRGERWSSLHFLKVLWPLPDPHTFFLYCKCHVPLRNCSHFRQQYEDIWLKPN